MARSRRSAGSLASACLAGRSGGRQEDGALPRCRSSALRAATARSPRPMAANSSAAQSVTSCAPGLSRAEARRALPSAARAAAAGRLRTDPRDLGQQPGQLVGRPGFEMQLLAAGEDGRQHALGAGRQQHDHRLRRRLLQGLEEGVGRRRVQPLAVGDDGHLPAGPGRPAGAGTGSGSARSAAPGCSGSPMATLLVAAQGDWWKGSAILAAKRARTSSSPAVAGAAPIQRMSGCWKLRTLTQLSQRRAGVQPAGIGAVQAAGELQGRGFLARAFGADEQQGLTQLAGLAQAFEPDQDGLAADERRWRSSCAPGPGRRPAAAARTGRAVSGAAANRPGQGACGRAGPRSRAALPRRERAGPPRR